MNNTELTAEQIKMVEETVDRKYKLMEMLKNFKQKELNKAIEAEKRKVKSRKKGKAAKKARKINRRK